MRFLGYSKGGRGYRLMEEKTGRIKYRRDGLFNESNFSFPHQSVKEYVTHLSKSSKPVGDIQPEAVQERNEPIVNEPIVIPESPVVRPVRDRKQVKRYGVDDFHMAEVNFVHSAFSVESNPEPVTLKEAFASKDSEKWRAVAQAEYDSLFEHDTWELCELPVGKKIIGSKWVLKVKYKENGEVDRYKCRLVAQGFTQAPGIDYNETFAPVARFGTIRTLLAIGAKRGMRIEQMDVTTAFLNGVLKENLYMAQPEEFVIPGTEHKVCHLKKSLYGLKQSPRSWYQELSKHLVATGFQESKADPWKEGRKANNYQYICG